MSDIQEEHNHSDCSSALRAYKMQALYLQRKYEEAQTQALAWKAKYESSIKQNVEIQKPSGISLFLSCMYTYSTIVQKHS